MKRWWLAIGLLLSLGFNIGLLTAMWTRSLAPPAPAPDVTLSAVDAEPEVTEAIRPPPIDAAVATESSAATDVRPRALDREVVADPGDPPTARESRAAMAPDDLVARMGLEGQKRQQFVMLQMRLQQSLKERLPRLGRLRRQLYREMVSPVPDGQRLRNLTERMARLNVEIERELVRTVVASRRLLDQRQEELYLRHIAARMRPFQNSLAPGPVRPLNRGLDRQGRPPG